ncbi:Spectrin beta chain, non-erythrocytic 1 [Apophysomyces ossiformis]|uniref:Spectrin beta chain, non-erythrocytic 1 n=1 Tax=Apophysomyces ossiformis TaxID=679940 RepID=A0A8H7ER72_9FUNG|nr:Spectrin beta chain, non-erythrocytic 1 [Apophysomyces ossiformis]
MTPSTSTTRKTNFNKGHADLGEDLVRNIGSDYQEIQKRTLTKWINVQLSTVDDHINNIETDLRDGRRLLKLLSVVSKETVPKPEKGNTRIHQITNVALALGFLEKQVGRDALPDIGNEAIVDGNIKKTLALTFLIMLKYQVQRILTEEDEEFFKSMENEQLHDSYQKNHIYSSDTFLNIPSLKTEPSTPLPSLSNPLITRRNRSNSSASDKGSKNVSEAKLALLYWVRLQLEDYVAAHIIWPVQDFSRSWRNGLAFCLLIHKHDPTLIPDLFTTHMRCDISEKETWYKLLVMAFDLAATHMDIPKYLEPEDLTDVDYPHEPSVMMYISQYYSVMSKAQKEQSADERARNMSMRKADISIIAGTESLIQSNESSVEENSPMSELTDSSKTTPEMIVSPPNNDMEAPKPSSSSIENIEPHMEPIGSVPSLLESIKELPQDLHGVVDQFIFVCNRLIELLRTNRHIIDEIPIEFPSNETLSTITAIEEQLRKESNTLEAVKEAKEALMKDSKVLADTQRAGISWTYNALRTDWDQFTNIFAEKQEKMRIKMRESDLGEDARDVSLFDREADIVEREIDTLQQSLRDIKPKSTNEHNVTYTMHPLDGSLDIAEEFENSVTHASKLIDAFNLTTWKLYKEQLSRLLPTVSFLVSGRKETVQQKYKALNDALLKAKRCTDEFSRGVTFAGITKAMTDELDVVQKMMDDTEQIITNDAIRNLEERVSIVRSTIYGVREEYIDLLTFWEDDDRTAFYERFIEHLNGVEEKYETVQDWVDQVRVWFVEAERIRKWIAEQIDIIEERNEAHLVDPLSAELSVSDEEAIRLYEEHKKLQVEIERFDADDMTRLRSHVKTLTVAERDRELSPADTSTIEITLTTLNMLNRLMQLLGKRSLLLDTLLLRVKWEDLFGKAVQWIASMDGELDRFLREKARWSELDGDYGEFTSEEKYIEDVIQSLVSIEKRIADFDQGDYAKVLDAYQETEYMHGEPLPEYLERRQTGFEKAFEDLMKRCAFVRNVVEQLLSVTNVVTQFKDLKDEGERLRRSMLDVSNTHEQDEDDELILERVQTFKENSANLITNGASRIPFPTVPDMATAIGGSDAHDTEITNETIRSTMSAYGMSLALIAEGLDQLLASRNNVASLQSRASVAHDEVIRMTNWMDEKIKNLSKSHFDIYADSSKLAMDEDEVMRLEKERDGIATRLNQLEDDDLIKLLQEVRTLEDDIDASNAVSIDRHALVNSIENLEKSHERLKSLLSSRSKELDVLKKRVLWESQWNKTNQWILTIARKLWDFNIKRARYDPSKDNVDKPSYTNDHENTQMLQFIQERVAEINDRQMLSINELFDDLTEEYGELSEDNNISSLPDCIVSKQSEIKQKCDELLHLSAYASDLMTQRSAITEFLLRVQDAQHEGERIRDGVNKFMRRIMEHDAHSFDSRTQAFKGEIQKIWDECGKIIPFPSFSCTWIRPTQPTESEELSAHIKDQIKSLLDRKMDDLRALEKTIDRLLEESREADRMKALVSKYDMEAAELRQWIEERIQDLKRQHIDVAAEYLADTSDDNLSRLQREQSQLFLKVQDFEGKQVKTLHDSVAQLVEKSMQKKSNRSVDVSAAARSLGEAMTLLAQLKQGLSDQSVSLEAAMKRASWEKKLQEGIAHLDSMNERLRQFNSKKNKWITQDDLSLQNMRVLEHELDVLNQDKDFFVDELMPDIQQCYEEFVEYFPRLSRPMAIPDHFEAQMESLGRTCARFQENLATRSKELDLLRDRIHWEETVKQALDYLAQQELSVEKFVQDKARWHPDAKISEDDEQMLRTTWADIKTDYDTYQTTTTEGLRTTFQHLRESAAMYNASLISDAILKRMQDVDNAEERVNHYLNFANEVVTQRCLVSAFILRTAQLEQSAEMIREEFIAANGNTAVHIERLERFKAGVNDVRHDLAGSIPYPVRSAEEIATSLRLEDETMNSVIQDAVDTRIVRLEEISSSLELLLESKERVSRRRMSLDAYKKQAEACEQWIGSRQELLRTSAVMLDVTDALDIAKLKEAVSTANSIETAMKAQDNVYTVLKTVYEKCLAAFSEKCSDVDDHQVTEELKNALPKQEIITESWNTLLDEAIRASKSMSTALIPAEISERINKLLAALRELDNNVKRADPTTVSDDEISEWQKRVDVLELKEYNALQVRVAEASSILDAETVGKAKSQLDLLADIVLQVRTELTSLYDVVNLNRLRKTYADNAAILKTKVESELAFIAELRNEFKLVDVANRASQYQSLVSGHKKSKDRMNDCKEAFDDLSAYYNLILAQSETDDVNGFHEDSKQTWATLLQQSSSLSGFVSGMAKWIEHYDKLREIKQALMNIEETLNVNQKISADTVLDMLTDQEMELTKLSEELSDVAVAVKQMDDENLSQFMVHYADVADQLQAIRTVLSERKLNWKKSSFSNAYYDSTRQLRQICEDKLEVVRHLSASNVDVVTKEANDIEAVVESNSTALEGAQETHDHCKEELESSIQQRGKLLMEELGYPREEVEQAQVVLSNLLGDLNKAIVSEKGYVEALKSIAQHAHMESSLMDALYSFETALSGQQPAAKDLTLDLNEIDRRYESLEDSMASLRKFGAEVKNGLGESIEIETDRKILVEKAIDQRYDVVHAKWDSVQCLVKEKRAYIEASKKRLQADAKISETIRYISNMKDRVNALQVPGKSMSIEEQELKELQEEVDSTLGKKTKDVDSLLETIAETDNALIQKREELTTAAAELRRLMQTRQKESCEDGNLAEFMSIVTKVETEANQLLVAVENAAPSHAGMVNNKYNKADLQALIKSLVASYKRHEPKVSALLVQAKVEAKKQYLDDNELVADKLAATIKRWIKAKSAAAARERELQACISELDHQFFMKLANAKTSTTRERRREPVARRPPPMPRQSPQKLAQSPRSVQTPISTSSAQAKPAYVPDPTSKLDVELGRIVNESPYRVKVKMVPGEVGKYWFGEENPRLVYCRILPSQLVMVRVGGGWVELSKFLRDHGLTEGVSTPRADTEPSPRAYQETFLQTVRSVSPSGRVTIRGGGAGGNSSSLAPSGSSSRSSNRSRSPASTGYVDGDRFIRVDQSGNQVAVKMTRAEEGAKMPVISKKRT